MELVERDDEHFYHSEAVTPGAASSRIIDSLLVCQDLKKGDGITFLIQANDRLNPLKKPHAGGWLNTWHTAEERMSADYEDIDEKERKTRGWDWQMRRVFLKRAALRALLRGVTSRAAATQKSFADAFYKYTLIWECRLLYDSFYGLANRTCEEEPRCVIGSNALHHVASEIIRLKVVPSYLMEDFLAAYHGYENKYVNHCEEVESVKNDNNDPLRSCDNNSDDGPMTSREKPITFVGI
ncbi:unnamed protein product [Haemonchus placei]|uniref:ACOX domain-containing protein n=1 Tax=Haemonchus placei TaxID=6290 RepID=A0A0N4WBE6_HAEPC|nr:unnamed protein product [Haemonchus placei]